MSRLAKIVADGISRVDGWLSAISGLGSAGRDRAAVSGVRYRRDTWIDQETIAALFHHDDLCKKAISIYPDEALRRPWKIEGPDSVAIKKAIKHLGLAQRICEAAKWGRAWGGGIVVLGVDDGRAPTAPIDRRKARRIYSADVYDMRRLFWEPNFRFTDPEDLLYGNAKIIRITPMYGGQFYVHRDRCLVLGGATTAAQEKETRAGWDASVLQAPFDVIRAFEQDWLALHNMMLDASTSVFKIKGLIDAVASPAQEHITTRAALLDLWRSTTRSVLLDVDEGEEFTKVATSFASLPELMDRVSRRVAASLDIPATVLGLDVVSGLGANGENDIRLWYDRVESYRTAELLPHFEHVLEIMAPDRGNEIEWLPLWQPTAKEKAETEKLKGEKRVAYIQNEVYTPEEVALSDEKETVTIDRRARQIVPTEAAFLPATTAAPGGPPGTPPALPPSTPTAPDAPTKDDDSEIKVDENVVQLAAGMTEHGVDACEHGRKNRCPLCGVERVRGISGLDPNGQPIWRVEWRAIS